ncbi:MAG TPA: HDOD domain-containing protein [Bacteroidota bacterium]|nr:HDOD domain-containing protein [Bacteroidota bacterium]
MKTLTLTPVPHEAKGKLTAKPSVVSEIMNLASDSRTSIARLSSTLLKDPSLTKGVLRKANSPYYGFSNRINTLDFAIVLLGFDVLKDTVSTLLVNNALRKMVNIIFEYEETWNHSLMCGIIAAYLAERSSLCDANDAFVAGLLHDVGFVILHQIVNDDTTPTNQLRNGRLVGPIEIAAGVSHSEAGFWTAGKWQLPPEIAEAIRYHHSPGLASLDPALTATVHVADVLCSRLQLGPFSGDGQLGYDESALELLRFDERELDREQLEQYCLKMRSDIDGGQSLEELVDDIKRRFVDAIGDLPDKQRIILALYYYENISFEEIGRVLRLDHATVVDLHARSLTTLKNVLWNIQPQRAAI